MNEFLKKHSTTIFLVILTIAISYVFIRLRKAEKNTYNLARTTDNFVSLFNYIKLEPKDNLTDKDMEEVQKILANMENQVKELQKNK